MPPLRWEQVTAPNYAGSAQIAANAQVGWDAAFGNIENVINQGRVRQENNILGRLTPQLAAVGTEAEADALIAGLNLSPDQYTPAVSAAIMGLTGQALGYEATRADTRYRDATTAMTSAQTAGIYGAEGRAQTDADRRIALENALADPNYTRTVMGGRDDAYNSYPTANSAAGGGISGTSGLLGLIDQHEGGGNYNTLFGHSQGDFGVNVSDMTVGQVLAFQRERGAGSYADFVQRTNPEGVLATPAGRYQIVGDTLDAAVERLGIDPNTPFNAQTQDFIASDLARNRLRGQTTAEGKRSAMRSEWAGFRNVDNATLDAAIAEFEAMPQGRLGPTVDAANGEGLSQGGGFGAALGALAQSPQQPGLVPGASASGTIAGNDRVQSVIDPNFDYSMGGIIPAGTNLEIVDGNFDAYSAGMAQRQGDRTSDMAYAESQRVIAEQQRAFEEAEIAEALALETSQGALTVEDGNRDIVSNATDYDVAVAAQANLGALAPGMTAPFSLTGNAIPGMAEARIAGASQLAAAEQSLQGNPVIRIQDRAQGFGSMDQSALSLAVTEAIPGLFESPAQVLTEVTAVRTALADTGVNISDAEAASLLLESAEQRGFGFDSALSYNRTSDDIILDRQTAIELGLTTMNPEAIQQAEELRTRTEIETGNITNLLGNLDIAGQRIASGEARGIDVTGERTEAETVLRDFLAQNGLTEAGVGGGTGTGAVVGPPAPGIPVSENEADPGSVVDREAATVLRGARGAVVAQPVQPTQSIPPSVVASVAPVVEAPVQPRIPEGMMQTRGGIVPISGTPENPLGGRFARQGAGYAPAPPLPESLPVASPVSPGGAQAAIDNAARPPAAGSVVTPEISGVPEEVLNMTLDYIENNTDFGAIINDRTKSRAERITALSGVIAEIVSDPLIPSEQRMRMIQSLQEIERGITARER